MQRALVFGGATLALVNWALGTAAGQDYQECPQEPEVVYVEVDPDVELEEELTYLIQEWPRYSMFENVRVRVRDGQVTLLGKVGLPYKFHAIEDLVWEHPDVESVTNDLTYPGHNHR